VLPNSASSSYIKSSVKWTVTFHLLFPRFKFEIRATFSGVAAASGKVGVELGIWISNSN